MSDYTNISKERVKSIHGDGMVSRITMNSNEMSEEDLNHIYNEMFKMISGIKRVSNK
jgi:hypothetical protein